MIRETAFAISHAYEVSQQKEKDLTDLGLVALDITLTALGVRANAKDFFEAAQRAQAGLKKAEPILQKGKQELLEAVEAKSRLHPDLPTLEVLQETCFGGSTPVLTPTGSKRIDELQEGDLVLSRSEHDVTGPVQARKIERLFKLANTIWEVRVSGQILETTSEHPF